MNAIVRPWSCEGHALAKYLNLNSLFAFPRSTNIGSYRVKWIYKLYGNIVVHFYTYNIIFPKLLQGPC